MKTDLRQSEDVGEKVDDVALRSSEVLDENLIDLVPVPALVPVLVDAVALSLKSV